MKVRLIACNEHEVLLDLTLGNVYEVSGGKVGGVLAITDDAGDDSELYFGEYEVVDEEFDE